MRRLVLSAYIHISQVTYVVCLECFLLFLPLSNPWQLGDEEKNLNMELEKSHINMRAYLIYVHIFCLKSRKFLN